MKSLPKLRQDLKISALNEDEDGFPQWCLFCQAKNQYYLMAWMEYEILSRWSLGNPHRIVEEVNQQTSLSISVEDIYLICEFIVSQELFVPSKPDDIEVLRHKVFLRIGKESAITSYLSFLIPLLKPDNFLAKTVKYVSMLFSKTAFIMYFIMAFIGIYLVSKQWSQFIDTFGDMLGAQNLFFFIAAVFLVKLIHEFSHAYVAKFYGCHITSIGFAVIVFRPALYTDITDAWRLKDKKQRLFISGAGITSELVVASVSMFLWNFIPPGEFKTLLFFIASFSWASSLLVNLNPLFCFDGYFLLSDYLEIPHMQDVAFELGTWRLREFLFGFNDEPPYYFKKRKMRALLLYAYLAWVYRAAFFGAVAVLSYYFLFKALGVLFMLTHLSYFVFRPILTEVKNYWLKRTSITMNRHSKRSLIIIFVIVALLVIPWQTRINLPAYIDYKEQFKLFSPADSFVDKVFFKPDANVKKGDVILRLKSPEMEYNLKQLNYLRQLLKTRYELDFGQGSLLGHKQVTSSELSSNQHAIKNLIEEMSLLEVKAPFKGRLNYLASKLHSGVWVSKESLLAEVVKNRAKVIYAYLPERSYHRVQVGMKGRFFLNRGMSVAVTVIEIDHSATEQLTQPYLASTFGGDIKVNLSSSHELFPARAVYRVHLIPDVGVDKFLHPGVGQVSIRAKRESIITRFWRLVGGVLMRESGF